jgi:hypothetical protein
MSLCECGASAVRLTLAAAFASWLPAPAQAPEDPAQAPDPFAPRLRWSHAAQAAQPWLPSSTTFAGADGLVWAAGSIASPRLALLPAAEDANGAASSPLAVDTGLAGALGTVAVAAGVPSGALFSCAQFPSPDALHRRTRVARHDALAAYAGGAFAPAWTRDLSLIGNGAARLACSGDGARLAAAVHDSTSGILEVDWLDGASGALLEQRLLSSQALRAIAASEDGRRLAIVAGAELWVLELGGSTLHHEALAVATPALALSGDGRTLLVGAGSALRVLADQGNGFAERFAANATPSETATRAAIANDGSTYAIGWWNHASGAGVRLQVWDGTGDQLVFETLQQGPPGGLQNFPEAVAVSGDGARAAFGLWGRLDAEPEVLLVDRALAQVVFSIDLPGSVQSLALDRTGTLIAAGMKHAHANQFATTGEFRLYDTGERDLTILEPPRPGGNLHLATRWQAASTALFLLGQAAGAASHPAGTAGGLWIDRGARMRIFARPADASGRADLVLPLPPDPAWVGVSFAAQSAARSGGVLRFSATVVEMVVL